MLKRTRPNDSMRFRKELINSIDQKTLNVHQLISLNLYKISGNPEDLSPALKYARVRLINIGGEPNRRVKSRKI